MEEVVSYAGVAVVSIPTIVLLFTKICDFFNRFFQRDIETYSSISEELELRRLKGQLKRSKAYAEIRNEVLERTEDSIDAFKRKKETDSRVKTIRESYGNYRCSLEEVKGIYNFSENGINIGDVRVLEEAIIEDIEACLKRENFGYTFSVYVREEYDVIYYELEKENPNYAE